ncbi:MAG: radical SAM protein [Candidatus Omnitrophica bacterium]|nr:radical SAM protein [Candidatus Omnitrophota bacterium]
MDNGKIDIVLVSPPFDLRENFGLLDFVGQYGSPINLLYLAASLEGAGISTKLSDLSYKNKSIEECAQYIVSMESEFVGIAVHFTFLVPKSLKLISIIKSLNPKIKIIVGGVHFTSLPEKTMNECREIDVGIIGEGEEVIVKVIKCLKAGDSLENLQGLIFRRGKELVKTEGGNLVSDINKLPFSLFEKIDLSHYSFAVYKEKRNNTFPIITSRGCPFSCTFCDRTVVGREIRFHNIDYLSKMIDTLVKEFKVNCFDVEDENICITKNRFKDICGLFKNMFQSYNITWHCSIRADSVNRETAKMLYDSGCRSVTFGIESGSQRMLNVYNKKLNINEMPEKCKIIRKAGITLAGSFIIGGPGENTESILETINLLKRIELDYMYLWYFVPFPGSVLYQDIENKGKLLGGYSNMTGQHISFIPLTLSREQLERGYKLIYRTFYSKPSVILKTIKKHGLKGIPKVFRSGIKYFSRFILN